MSEKNKSRSSKKWLISRMKTSGSKRAYVSSYDYADTRNAKRKLRLEDMPMRESMSRSYKFYNGRINTDLLKRFLNKRINQDWNDVFAEVVERIPAKLQEYKFCIYWYVADKVEIKGGQVWNLRNNSIIPFNNKELYSKLGDGYKYIDFYVDPMSNKLVKIDGFHSRSSTRNLNAGDLRKFRENERRRKLMHMRSKKTTKEESCKLKVILKQGKRPSERRRYFVV